MSADHRVRVSGVLGSLLFPAIGVIAGVTAFAVLYFGWPAVIPGLDAPRQAPRPQATDRAGAGPSAVRGLQVVAGDGAITVSWQPPADASAAAAYVVEAVPDDGDLETRRCATTARSCVVGGLTDGALYNVAVRTEDDAGALSAPQRAEETPRPDLLVASSSALWLDAADPATLDLASAWPAAGTAALASPASGAMSGAVGSVLRWHDKSGRGIVASQPAAAARPLLSVLGKRAALMFAGAQNLTFDGSQLPSGSTESTAFVVVREDDPHAPSSCFAHVLAWGANRTGQARAVLKGCSTNMAYLDTFDTWTAMKPAKPWPTGQVALLTATVTRSAVEVRMNRRPDYTWPIPAATPLVTGIRQAAAIGGAPWWRDSAGWIGLIGEVIVLSGPLGTGDRNRVEQYLARKWGIP